MNKVLRWLPAMVAPVMIAAAVTIPAMANADPTLPSKTPAQLIALIGGSQHAAYSGTVQESSDLGLPDLGSLQSATGISLGGSSLSSWASFLTASHTARVFVDGPEKQRLQLLGSWAETDLIHNGTSLWEYDSQAGSAAHLQLSSDASSAAHPDALPGGTALTPAQAAAKLIAAITPSTTLTVSTSDRVAGRAVYSLTLTPKTSATLVDHTTLAVDAFTGLPLSAAVYARGQSAPAFTTAFTSISYGAPAASVFDFTPPAGTTVSQLTPMELLSGLGGSAPPKGLGAFAPKPKITGSDWATIVELPAGTGSALLGASTGTRSAAPDVSSLAGSLLTPVAGGEGLQTALVSVLVTADGRLFAGAVPLAALEAAAK
ncbi:DUF2092 domain-containing protein [Gryllotalpicola sp.]|uniref:LolA family protein n=1 Tax=Gryllotalpicola sp. TaxID=1932787 RepID=UPI0026268E41|nr:DUF2092 domain-containing protein [Gryllotalpicola sp.]